MSSRSAFMIFHLLDKYKALVDQALPNPVGRTANTSLPCSKSAIASFCSSFKSRTSFRTNRLNIAFRNLETLEILSLDKPCCFRSLRTVPVFLLTDALCYGPIRYCRCWTLVAGKIGQSPYFSCQNLSTPPPPPPPLGSYIALPSSRSLLKTKMAKVCARSRRSNGKIGDCEQSILLLVPFAVFLLCCLTGSRGYCNVSFYFFGHFGCHVKLHHSKAHGTFKLRKHGGRTFYKLKPTISSVVDLPESTGSVALRLSRKTLRS